MSKKASLSNSGSLAACLHFAAQVLAPGAKDIPQAPEALTKDVLTPIVVDAHRFGLQMTKLASGRDDEHNPRKLLHLCREKSDEKIQKTMSGIAVADITWDFQGAVDDTLEMELEDLLQRARAGEHAICTLFSVSAPETARGGDEHALVWIPAEEHSSAHSAKHSMLLYVCPGRVKVVKSIGDLVRKMREEIKTIRGGNASYCVWSVIAAPKADGQRQSRPKDSATPKPVLWSEALKEKEIATSAATPATVEVKKRVEYDAVSSAAPIRHEATNNDDNGSDRISSGNASEATDAVTSSGKRPSSSSVSISHFGRVAPGCDGVKGFESVRSSQRLPQRDDEIVDTASGGRHRIELRDDENCAQKAISEVPHDSKECLSVRGGAASVGNQDEDEARDVISDPERDDDRCSPVLEEPQPTRAEWLQSDPHIPVSRSSAINRQHPQATTLCLSRSVDGQAVTPGLQAAQDERSRLKLPLHAEPSGTNDAPPEVVKPLEGNSPTRSGEVEETNPAEAAKVPATIRNTTIARVVAKIPPPHSIFAFTSSLSDYNEGPDEIAGAMEQEERASRRDPRARDPRQEHAACDNRTSSSSLPTDEHPSAPSSPVEQAADSDMRRSISFAACDSALGSPLTPPTVADCPPQEEKKKSARDRVRAKLGAKVWWELEYTARQLEHEAAQSKWLHEGSSYRPGDPGQCNGGNSSRQQASKPTPASTVEQQAAQAPVCKISSPTTVVESALDAITEELQSPTPPARSLPMDRRPIQVPSDKTFARAAADIHADESLGGRLGSSGHKQTGSTAFAVRDSRNPPVEQQKSMGPVVTNYSISNTQKTESNRIEPNPKMKAWAAESKITKDSLSSTSAKTRCDEPSPKPIGRPNGSCKPDTQPKPLGWVTSDSSTPATTKAPAPSARASYAQANSPLHDNHSRLSPQERASPVRFRCEQPEGRCTKQKSVDEMRERSVIRHNHCQNDGAGSDEDDDEAASQAQWASTRTSYDAHTHQNASPTEKPVDHLCGFVAGRLPSGGTSVPFHLNGRVPIWTHQGHSAPKAHHNDLDTNDKYPNRDQSAPSTVEGEDPPAVESTHRTTSSPPSHPSRPSAATATATFIPFHDDKGVLNAGKKEAATRMDRLNELRQKKLEQLQKAREHALHQQQEKKHRQLEKKSTPDSEESSSLTGGGTAASHHTHHQLRVKRASNRQQLQNAIEFTLLAGQSNERERLAALEALAQSPAESFVVLLKSAKELKFRALYESRTDSDEARRVYSVVSSAYAPSRLTPGAVAQFFKYSSAKKQFLAVDTRSFTVTTDACALVDQLVFKKTAKPRLL